jgi:hypothetical protein
MKVIAISGWKRSGKDTIAAQLIEKYGFTRVAFADPLKDSVAREYGIPREHCDDPAFKEAPILHLPLSPKDQFGLGVAELIYKECRTADGKTPFDYWIDPSGAFLGVYSYGSAFTERETVSQLYWTPRALCILKGSINRVVRSDYWVKAAIEGIQTASTHAMNDPSFGGFVISDLRYKSELAQLRQAFGKNLITVRINRFDECNSQDASERDLDNGVFDVTIENRGTLEELLSKVKELVK